jgi:hypothetical protein
LYLKYSITFAPSKNINYQIKPKMKKLFAVLMIAGLFGFASCGDANKTSEEANQEAADSVADVAQDAAAAENATPNSVAAATDSAAAAATPVDSMK